MRRDIERREEKGALHSMATTSMYEKNTGVSNWA